MAPQENRFFIFWFALILLAISLPFKHTKGLFLFSRILIVALFFLDRKNFDILKRLFVDKFYIFFLALLFICFCFVSVFYSCLPGISLHVFLREYLLNFLFALSLGVNLKNFIESTSLETILFPFFIINILFLIFFAFFLVRDCQDLSCYVLYPQSLVDIYFQGYWRLSLVLSGFACLNLFLFFLSNGKGRWFYFVVLLLDLVVLVLLRRRAALLGFSIPLFVSLFFESYIRRLVVYCLVFICVFCFLIYISPFGKKIFIHHDNPLQLLSAEKKDFKKVGSMGLRLHAWLVYLDCLKKSPLKGTGLGIKAQKKKLQDQLKEAILLEAHNGFINLSLQAGILAGVSFFVFLLSLIFDSLKSLWKNPHFVGYFFVFYLFFSNFLIQTFFEHTLQKNKFFFFWFFWGLFNTTSLLVKENYESSFSFKR